MARFEIKGDVPTSDEQEKAACLAEESKKRAIILYGDIPLPEKDFQPKSFIVGLLPNGNAAVGLDLGHYWCQCPLCCTIGFTNPSKPFPPVCLCSYQRPHLAECVVRPRFNSPYLLENYTDARQACFEHDDVKPKQKVKVSSAPTSAPSLTIEEVKDCWQYIDKQARSKKDGNKTAALLKYFTVTVVEGTKDLPVIVLQTKNIFAYNVLSQDTHQSVLQI